MPSITALLHTENDSLRLGRALETLYPCDEIVIIDHDSQDASRHIARAYGARIINAQAGMAAREYLQSSSHSWVLCLEPFEALTEGLAASLFEWKLESNPTNSGRAPVFAVVLREETAKGWIDRPAPQPRLVRSDWDRWDGRLPREDQSARILNGELLRFAFP